MLQSPPDRRSNALRAERIIAGDLIRVTSPTLDEALDWLADYMERNPDATPEEVLLAMGPMLDRGVAIYIDAIYGVLAEDVPAGIDGVSR